MVGVVGSNPIVPTNRTHHLELTLLLTAFDLGVFLHA